MNAVRHPDDRRVLSSAIALACSGVVLRGSARRRLASRISSRRARFLGPVIDQIVEPALLDRLAVSDQPGAIGRGTRRGRGGTARSRHGWRCPRPSRGRSSCLSVGTFGSASTSGIGKSQPGLSPVRHLGGQSSRHDQNSKNQRHTRSSRHRQEPRFARNGPFSRGRNSLIERRPVPKPSPSGPAGSNGSDH